MTPKILQEVNFIAMLAEYKDLMNSSNWNVYQAGLMRRNDSSAEWDDDSEFPVTPDKNISPFRLHPLL